MDILNILQSVALTSQFTAYNFFGHNFALSDCHHVGQERRMEGGANGRGGQSVKGLQLFVKRNQLGAMCETIGLKANLINKPECCGKCWKKKKTRMLLANLHVQCPCHTHSLILTCQRWLKNKAAAALLMQLFPRRFGCKCA